MRKIAILMLSLLAAVVWAGPHASAFEPPEPKYAVRIVPAFSDRRFPYVTYQTVWKGTSVKKDHVAVPNVRIVYGDREAVAIVAAASSLTFYLGNWAEDIGFGVEEVRNRRMPALLLNETGAEARMPANVIVLGTRNRLLTRYQIRFDGPSVIHKSDGERQFLFVGGKTPQETVTAIRYLADMRLNFKSGAYKTFFNFVKLRGYLEGGNWAAALETIQSPGGLSACGRNMALAAPKMARAPKKITEHIAHRNRLLYQRLPEAVKARDQQKGLTLWHEAMTTCYACHQGADPIPRLRKFSPTASIHSGHQWVAAKFKNLQSCEACHHGSTQVKGYD